MDPIDRATPEGTRRYAERLGAAVAPEHFRNAQKLWTSTIGLGTYLGDPDDATDRLYEDAIRRAVALGCNVIDAAINYRFQRSERAIGAALRQLIDSGAASRAEIIVATKGGYIPFDGGPPADPRGWIIENIINTGAAAPGDIVGGHCMSPSYLDNQLSRSLDNLGLDCIDVYYIHNPESQLDGVSRDEFRTRLRAAFEFLEGAAGDGRIAGYGTATWNGYRQPPRARGYLSLTELVEVAREVGGEDHCFRYIQLPLNLAMPEALTLENQKLDGGMTSTLVAAGRLGITVMCSASLLQAQLTGGLPDFIAAALTGLDTDAQRALQFTRSAPGVTTALVGMSRREHVEENMRVAKLPPAPIEDFLKIFSRGEE